VKELFEEYEDGRTAEALLVKDFDKVGGHCKQLNCMKRHYIAAV
jgi:hypothetical protein